MSVNSQTENQKDTVNTSNPSSRKTKVTLIAISAMLVFSKLVFLQEEVPIAELAQQKQTKDIRI